MATDPRLARSARQATATPPIPPAAPESTPHNVREAEAGDRRSPEKSQPAEKDRADSGGGGFKLKFCTVCASNQNRSMEAHLQLSQSSFPVLSFGTGSLVRLPGPTITTPNVYAFNTTSYASMHAELQAKDARLYRANGLLAMLERNRGIKWGPERWQDWRPGVPRVGDAKHAADRGARGVEAGVVDVVITCEERCWDAVLDDLALNRAAGGLNRPVHVINVDIRDNHEEALVGGKAILDLAERLNDAATEERERAGGARADGWDDGKGGARAGFDERVPEVLAEWQERWPNLPALWTLAWL